MEIVPHFPHVGRVAHFCQLPVRMGGDGEGGVEMCVGGGRACSFFAGLTNLTIVHASLLRRGTAGEGDGYSLVDRRGDCGHYLYPRTYSRYYLVYETSRCHVRVDLPSPSPTPPVPPCVSRNRGGQRRVPRSTARRVRPQGNRLTPNV